MAAVTQITDLNREFEERRGQREESSDRIGREYSRIPFLARDQPNPKGARPVVGDQYLPKSKRFVQALIEDSKAKAAQDPEIRNLSRYVDLVMGKHWTGTAPSYKRRPVVNKLNKHFWDNLANSADLRFSLDVQTESADKNFVEIATALTKLCQSNFHNQSGIAAVLFASEFASLGSGYIKVTRDRSVRDVTYTPLGPDACIPILCNVFDFQKSAGVIHRMMKPMSWFEQYHPKVYHLIHAQRPPVDMYSQSDALALGATTYQAWTRSQGSAMGVSSLMNVSSDQFSVQSFATEEGAVYDEIHFRDAQLNRTGRSLWMGYGNWTYEVKPGEPFYPYGRMVSVAGEEDPVILWDGPNMHWHASYPFAKLSLSPVFWMMSGMSDLRDLVAINGPFNRILGAGMNLLEQAERPTVVTREGAMANEAWANFMPGAPGGKLKLTGKFQAILEQIQFIHPPIGVLGSVIAMLSFLDNQFAQQSGQGYGSKMAGKKQIPGSESIQAIQESEQGRYRVKGIFTELLFKGLGQLVMSDIIQFYDPDKVASVLGPDEDTWEYLETEAGGIVPKDVREGDFRKGNKFVSQFAAMMVPGSSLPVKRREQANMALSLAAGGRISNKTLYKKLNAVGAGLPDWEVEAKQILLERKMLPMPPAKGKASRPQPVPPESGQ